MVSKRGNTDLCFLGYLDLSQALTYHFQAYTLKMAAGMLNIDNVTNRQEEYVYIFYLLV